MNRQFETDDSSWELEKNFNHNHASTETDNRNTSTNKTPGTTHGLSLFIRHTSSNEMASILTDH